MFVLILTQVYHPETGSGSHASFGKETPTPSIRRNSVESIMELRQRKYTRIVVNAPLGPPKAEDPNHIRLQELG